MKIILNIISLIFWENKTDECCVYHLVLKGIALWDRLLNVIMNFDLKCGNITVKTQHSSVILNIISLIFWGKQDDNAVFTTLYFKSRGVRKKDRSMANEYVQMLVDW